MLKTFFNGAKRGAAIERARKANHEAFGLPGTSYRPDMDSMMDPDVRGSANAFGEK